MEMKGVRRLEWVWAGHINRGLVSMGQDLRQVWMLRAAMDAALALAVHAWGGRAVTGGWAVPGFRTERGGTAWDGF